MAKRKSKRSNQQNKQVKLSRTKNIESQYRYAIYKMDRSIQLGEEFGNITLPTGQSVLMPTGLNVEYRQPVSALESLLKPIQPNSKLKGKSILVVRYGGIGDIIAALYGIAELKGKFGGDIKVGFLAAFKYLQLLQCFPKLVDFVIGPVCNSKVITQFKHIVYLDDIVETSEKAKLETIHQIYASEMCVNVTKNTTKFVASLNNALSEGEKQGIGIQYKSNAIIRDYDIELLITLINKIIEKYNEPIYLLGPADDYKFVNYIQSKVNGQVIANGCGITPPFNLAQVVNLVSKLKLVIGPDSSMLHVAGICETPSLGLFGPFPSNLRTSLYPKAIGIDGKTNCSPCFRHFPLDFCVANNARGICINSITPEIIMEQLENFDLSLKPISQ